MILIYYAGFGFIIWFAWFSIRGGKISDEVMDFIGGGLFKVLGLVFQIVALPFRVIWLVLRGVRALAQMIEHLRIRNNWGFYSYYAAIVLPSLSAYCATVKWINDPNQETAKLTTILGLICIAVAGLAGIAFMTSDGNKPRTAADSTSEWPYNIRK